MLPALFHVDPQLEHSLVATSNALKFELLKAPTDIETERLIPH